MNDFGDFPITENYPVFKSYLTASAPVKSPSHRRGGPQTRGKSKNGKQQSRRTLEMRPTADDGGLSPESDEDQDFAPAVSGAPGVKTIRQEENA